MVWHTVRSSSSPCSDTTVPARYVEVFLSRLRVSYLGARGLSLGCAHSEIFGVRSDEGIKAEASRYRV